MRSHFRTPELFLDYYADLAESLARRPLRAGAADRVADRGFLFEDALTARVQVRFRGADDRPLRPGRVELVRVDRWEWADGTWWIRPGRVCRQTNPWRSPSSEAPRSL